MAVFNLTYFAAPAKFLQMLRTLITSTLVSLLFASSLSAERMPLSKSLSNLSDFYYSCLLGQSKAIDDKSGAPTSFIPSIYRDAIQYELVRDTVWVKVFITTNVASAQSALGHFRSMNLRSLSQFGNIFAAKIDLMELPKLNRLAFVERIEPVVPDGASARASLSKIDVGKIEKKVTDSSFAIGAAPNSKVIIGLIDTGIDFTHPEFRRDLGHKVIALWDQLDTSRNNYTFEDGTALGSVYYGAEINSDACPSVDVDGHGTMVASAAVGNSCGIAPDADLVVVKVDYFNFDDMMLAYGIEFIRKTATERNLPYVISLSYLPKGGAKDGETGVLARILEGELATNLGGGLLKSIVAAAGNENYEATNQCRDENNRMHVHKAGTGDFDLEISTTSNDPNDDACVLELWYPVENSYSILLTSPSGRIYGPVDPDVRPIKDFGDNGFLMISNNRQGMEKWGAMRIVMRDPDSAMAAVTSAGPLRAGTWNIQMIGDSGVWHGYVTYQSPAEIVKAISKADQTNQFKIRSAGNVRDVVTVGSINNGTVTWRDLFGMTTDFTGCYDPNEISHFSSRGPTKAGVDKPDIYTDGAWVRLAASKDVTIELGDSRRRKTLYSDEYYIMEEGTSFAAPRVAGAIAQMIAMDSDSSLTHDRIKFILENTAKRRGRGVDSFRCLDFEKALELSVKY